MISFFFPSKQIKGQGLVEYAIILSLVAILVITVVLVLGPRIGNTFSTINSSLEFSGDDSADIACSAASNRVACKACVNTGGTWEGDHCSAPNP